MGFLGPFVWVSLDLLYGFSWPYCMGFLGVFCMDILGPTARVSWGLLHAVHGCPGTYCMGFLVPTALVSWGLLHGFPILLLGFSGPTPWALTLHAPHPVQEVERGWR